MRQKTFILDTHSLMQFGYDMPKVGQEILLACWTDMRTQKETWVAWRVKPLGESFEENEGVGGNIDSSDKMFHGWRGTTNDRYFEAYGVRKIIKVSTVDVLDYKITVGPDLHPDWE